MQAYLATQRRMPRPSLRLASLVRLESDALRATARYPASRLSLPIESPVSHLLAELSVMHEMNIQ
jgi:hypothetical protein